MASSAQLVTRRGQQPPAFAAAKQKAGRPVRAVVVVIDGGLGMGNVPNCPAVDVNCDTVGNAAIAYNTAHPGEFDLPFFSQLGVALARQSLGRPMVPGVEITASPLGLFGIFDPSRIFHTDTTVDHWAMVGLETDEYPVYHPGGIPLELMAKVEREVKARLGIEVEFLKKERNSMSGTKVIEAYGPASSPEGQLKKPIIYTSSDSVFQIAYKIGRELGEGGVLRSGEELVMEEVEEGGIKIIKKYAIDLADVERMRLICKTVREILTESSNHEDHFLRVIARPFVDRAQPSKKGEKYIRVASIRKDYVLDVPGTTLLDILASLGYKNLGIGKIGEIFSGRGLAENWPKGRHLTSDMEGLDLLTEALAKWQESGIIFVNLVDSDERFGHRNDAEGFARNLMAIAARLKAIRENLSPWDIVVLTADHGNDPTRALTRPGTPEREWRLSNHTREWLFFALFASAQNYFLKTGTNLGVRHLASLGATLADFFGCDYPPHGESFFNEIVRPEYTLAA